MEKIYLLTGAAGLLGSNITMQLIDRGERVRALVLKGDPAIKFVPPQAEIVEGNILDAQTLDKFFDVDKNCEVVVIHSASIVTLDPKPNPKVYAVNVTGTQNIVDKCVEKGVKRLVYISSTSAIPELPAGQKIQEVGFHDANAVIGFYGKTKAEATEIVLKAVKEKGLDACVVYPSGIFGPNDYGFGLVTSGIKMFAEGKLKIAIGGTFNSVDVRDLAEGIINCALKGRKGETYIMASRCYSFRELLDTISVEAGIKKPLLTVPLWIVRPFAWMGNAYSGITNTPLLFSNYTMYNLARNNDYDAKKAQEELGFKCRPLNESIIDTIKWLKAAGKLSQKTKAEA